MNTSFLLPDTFEAERMVISACMASDTHFQIARQTVSARDFANTYTARGFDWLTENSDAGRGTSFRSLKAVYGAHPDFQGFADSVMSLDECIPGMIQQWVGILADKAMLYRAALGLSNAAELAGASTTFEEVKPSLDALFSELCGVDPRRPIVHIKKVVEEIRAELDSPTEPRVCITTGFQKLDRMLNGNPKPSHLVILAAGTGGGKTSLALNIACHVAANVAPVGIFSLEMDRKELALRAGFSLTTVDDTPDSTLEKVSGLPIYISDSPDQSAEQIRGAVKMMAARVGVKLIIIDYLQLLRDSGNKNGTREREVAAMSRALKLAAKEAGVCVLALSQVNEAGELRESRAIDQDADLVLHLLPDADRHYLRITKHRHGPRHGSRKDAEGAVGDKIGVPLHFDAPNFRFHEA